MPKSKRPSLGPHDVRACTECRKRKTKCSGNQPCSYCSRVKKSCIFGPPPSRTPLTRKNLDATELRCAALVSLIQRIDPDVDVEVALEDLTSNPSVDIGAFASTSQAPRRDPENDAISDRLEWNEPSLTSPSAAQDVPLDGMASLPSKRAESGYLGNSSGSSLLRSISDLIPHKESISRRGNDEQSLITETASVASPSVPVNLADTATINSLIDAYFTWYNPAYPILHERTFRRECENRQQIHPRSTWHAIFFLVLAIGHWTVTEDAERSHYYTAARSRMSMRMLESGTLLAVQAFLLMGNYLQKRDRPNTGYNFVGIAYRMALGLGLHREPPSGTATANTLLNERRRVVWWTVYCFDSGFSFTTGRPIMVSDSFIETKLPRNIDDSNIELNSILPAPTESPTSYSAIIAQSRLASIGNVVFSEILSSTSQSPWDLKISRSIDNQFKAWRLSLPCYFTAPNVPHWFQGPRAIVGWKEQNLRMMLWWGSKRLCSLPSDHEEAQNMCHFTAVETIQDISNFCRDNTDVLHAGLSWYATYFLFQAAVVLSIHHLRPTHPDHTALEHGSNELWLSSIIRSRDCLASLTRRNSAAARCLEVLERISVRLQPLDQSSTPAPGPEARVDYPPVTLQEHEVPAEFDVPSALMAVDPTLQMLFEDTSWDKDLFEGLNGFPSTGEGEAFDYMPSNVDQTWLRSFDTAK